MAKKAVIYLSQKLRTKVSIESLEIEFFKTIVLNNFYIEDQHADTLIYAKQLKVDIGKFDIENQKINISKILLLQTQTALIKYKNDEDFNFQFIIDAFGKRNNTTQKPNAPWDISIGKLELINSDFIYRNEHDTLITTGVNYVDFKIHNINGNFSEIYIDNDTIFGNINKLSVIEKSGFFVQQLSSKVKICPVEVKLDNLKIITLKSNIATNLVFSYKQYNDFNDFIKEVKMKGDFDHSILEMNDISYFAPELKGLYQKIIISGNINGTVDDIRGKDMDLSFGNSTSFIGDVALTGLPEIDQTVIHLSIKKLESNYKDLIKIPVPPFTENKKLVVNSQFAKLGTMKFKGTFTGLYNDFYAYGDFSSALGKLSSDLSVQRDREKNKEYYKGKLKAINFDFGKFFDIDSLGKVTMDVSIDGSGLSLQDINGQLDGTVKSLTYNSYTYSNIVVEGNIANKIFNGKLNIDDENLNFDFSGNVDFTQKLPKLNFTANINKANLTVLHFINTTKKTNFTTHLTINVNGDDIDNLVGSVNFNNTIYQQDNETLKINTFNLVAEENSDKKKIRLASDFLKGNISGKFKVLELSNSIQNLFQKYVPSFFEKKYKIKKKSEIQNFDYSLLFDKTDEITKLFLPQLKISPKTTIKGNFNSLNNEFSLDGNSMRLDVYGYVLNNWNLEATSTPNQFNLNMNVKRLYLSDSLWLNDFNIATKTHSDSINLGVTWDNKKQILNKGDINAFFAIKSNNNFEFKIEPSQFIINDSIWNIQKSNNIIFDSTAIIVKDLIVEHNAQSISLNGIISNNKSDQLKLNCNNFNIASINTFIKPSGLIFKGTINGESIITDFYNELIFTSDNSFKSLSINDNSMGDGSVESVWDNNKHALYLHGSFSLGIVPNVLFSGFYYPKKKEDNIDMELNLQAFQMQLFEPFAKGYCKDIKGFIAGNINVKGSLDKPKLSGFLDVNAKKITVDYLNTSYNFSHKIIIENNSFGVENLELFDSNHNSAMVTGKLYHDNFKNFQLDYDLNVEKFMCLNTTEADNNLYYGKAFVSGIVNIYGFIKDKIKITANLKTDKVMVGNRLDKFNLRSTAELTKFYIPLSNSNQVNDNNFITFLKKDSIIKIKNNLSTRDAGIVLDFDLDVTPDAEIQLIFDEKVGDIIKARGAGNIKLNINSTGEFKMYGNYAIDEGDYLFTLKNIINKRFYIEKGGTIKWNGVPYKADLDISAVYKARANLTHFFPEETTDKYKKRVPIDLKLLMTGDLLSPKINFDIGIPTVDASTRQQVLSYMNNDAEMNRQVFSLLVLNNFVTPYQLVNSDSKSGGPLNAAGSNSTEMLSNQLSNMLSKISKDVDIGINYRAGDEISKKEVELALSTQLFNDKLTIDANGGNNSSTQNTNNIVGDVNIEYKLTDDGKLKIKTFTRSNDNTETTITSGPYTQGIGIFYREEFDTIGELFKRYLNLVSKKKKSVPEKGKTPN
ncbi:MAG: translocation/assembly module TamB domain-containing protein [Bacteroidia bacterium]